MEKNILNFGIIILIVLVIIGIYLAIPKPASEKKSELNQTILNCAGQGEQYDFSEPSTPNECCEGLKDVSSMDSISIADECYWNGMESGFPGGICSNCGNGICEDIENVCGCGEDCIGKEKSTFSTIQDFCTNGYEQFCSNLPEGFELELCNLCP